MSTALQNTSEAGSRPLTQRMVRAAEFINSGLATEKALLAAGYSPATARGDAHKVLARLRAHGLVSAPGDVQATVAARLAQIEAHQDRLAAKLERIDAMIDAALDGAELTRDQRAVMADIQDRTLGKAAVHIHGHKDQEDRDAERELTVRVIRE